MEQKGLVSGLPMPFINGQPADVDKMNVAELRDFINLAYRCFHLAELPTMSKTKVSSSSVESPTPPSWWPKAITFSKNLELRPGYFKKWTKKYLVHLLYRFYEACGCVSLLTMASDLQNAIKDSSTAAKLQETPEDVVKNLWNDSSNPSSVDDRHMNKKGAEIKKSSYSSDSSASHPKTDSDDDDKHSESFGQVKLEAESIKDEPYQGDAFLNALGLMRISEVKPKAITSTPPPDPPQETPVVGRRPQKRPARNPFLTLIQDKPHLELTSSFGQRLIEKYGGECSKMEHKYPPAYEVYCKTDINRSREAKLKVPITDFPNVCAKRVLKNGIDPHIYSYGKGKRQRTLRYQELVIGLKQRCWTALNSCKKARLRLRRANPTKKKVSRYVARTSFLRRAFSGAIDLPRIKVVDVVKHPMKAINYNVEQCLELQEEWGEVKSKK